MRVCDVMTRPVLTTKPGAPVKDAAVILAGHGFTVLPVVGEDGQLVGVLTETDVLRGRLSAAPRHQVGQGVEAGRTAPETVAEVMSQSPLVADPQADAADLAATMIDRGLRSVPVVNDDRLVGIVTRRDLARVIARDDGSSASSTTRQRTSSVRGSGPKW